MPWPCISCSTISAASIRRFASRPRCWPVLQITSGRWKICSVGGLNSWGRHPKVRPLNLVRRRCACAVILPHGSRRKNRAQTLTMQYPFSCSPATYSAIESSLSAPRLSRYLPAANGDKHFAFRLYVWNARICEDFYLPTQITEVAIRNAVHKALMRRYGVDWDQRGDFLCTLPKRLTEALSDARDSERNQQGTRLTINHLVSSLSFGFWVHLTTQDYGHLIWKQGVRAEFPNFPKKGKLFELHAALDRFRMFRNRVAHHNAVFDKSPTAELRRMQEIVGWICPETLWVMNELSNVSRTINQRPKS